MARLIAIIAAAVALSGCANVADTSPSYLGMHAGAAASERTQGDTKSPSRAAPAAVKHVSSNRVLGAMAFQKVTGAEVAPERLVNRAP